jgi:hypothetical protein
MSVIYSAPRPQALDIKRVELCRAIADGLHRAFRTASTQATLDACCQLAAEVRRPELERDNRETWRRLHRR